MSENSFFLFLLFSDFTNRTLLKMLDGNHELCISNWRVVVDASNVYGEFSHTFAQSDTTLMFRPTALSTVYRFTTKALDCFPMGDNDLFCLGRTVNIHNGTLANFNLNVCYERCVQQQKWRVKSDCLRWCRRCSKWFHVQCMQRVPGVSQVVLRIEGNKGQEEEEEDEDAEGIDDVDEEDTDGSDADEEKRVTPGEEGGEVDRDDKYEQVSDGLLFLRCIASLPIERFQGRTRMHRTYEALVSTARVMMVSHGYANEVRKDWRDEYVMRMCRQWDKKQKDGGWVDGYNDWNLIDVSLRLSQLARALKRGFYKDIAWYACPICQTMV